MSRLPGRILAAAVLFSTCLFTHAADYYVGDTGRTDKTTVAPSEMPMGDAQSTGTSQAGDAPTVFELDPKELYFPEVEAAIKASGVDRLAVQSEGVPMSIRTFAAINVNTITARRSFEKQDPVYTVLGMIYQNKLWVRSPILPVESKELAEAFGLDPKAHNRVSPVWIMKTPKARALVMGALSGDSAVTDNLPKELEKPLSKFAMRMAAFLNLPSEFKLVPLGEGSDVWLSPSHLQNPSLLQDPALMEKVARLDKKAEPFAAVLALDAELRKAYEEQNPEGLAAATASAQAKLIGSRDYIAQGQLQADYWNTRIRPFQKSALVYFAAFGAFLIYFFTARKPSGRDKGKPGTWEDGRVEEYAPGPQPGATAPANVLLNALAPNTGMAMSAAGAGGAAADFPLGGTLTPGAGSGAGAEGRHFHTVSGYGDPILDGQIETAQGNRVAWAFAYGLMILAALVLVAGLVTRAWIKGWSMPVSNMYESITFAMGAFSIVAVIFEGIYRRGWVGAGACLAGWGLMMLANSMPIYSRKVEPLVAVLNSVWLNFHVTSLLISYSCFLMAFVFGILFMVKDLTGNRPGRLPRAETFEYLTYRSVQVGWPLLTLGIFLGAVWANTAWGSFWSWDPKETWALITWLTYTIYLHLRINLGWTGRKSVIASMIGFAMMLLTYFGVSYLPGLSGGLHSYAAPIKRS